MGIFRQNSTTFQMVIRPLKWSFSHPKKEFNHSEGLKGHSEGFKCHRVFLYFLIALFLFSCSNNDKEVVASVNGTEITSEEIAFAYEFAPRKITQQGKDKALKMILDGMVKKQLFAEEAINHNLDENPEIQESIDYFTRAAINRELYKKHVRDSIIIDDASIVQAYKRSNELLFVKHFITTDEKEAGWISRGEIDVIHQTINQNETEIVKFGKVDQITFNQINQKFEDVIFSLPLMQLSEPIFDGKYYHVFRVVDKSIDGMQTVEDFQKNEESLANALRKRAEHQRAFQFVNHIMEPENLVIKADALNWMVEKIKFQKNPDIKPRLLTNIELQSFDESDMLTKNIAEFKSGEITIEDFQKIYLMNSIEISTKNENSIRSGLKNIIAIYVRDKVFSKIGIAENLDQKESVQEERKFWEVRLLANELKRKIYDDLNTATSDSSQLDDIYNEAIENLTKELYAKSTIEIDGEKLKSIRTSDEGLSRKIDFFAKYLQ